MFLTKLQLSYNLRSIDIMYLFPLDTFNFVGTFESDELIVEKS